MLSAGDEAGRALLARYDASLASYLVVSTVTFDGPPPAPGEVWGVAVAKSPHAKCERCWNHRPTVGADATHPTLCDRCVAALPPGFARPEPAPPVGA
jgi:isoleucyl-tRNA synthetase